MEAERVSPEDVEEPLDVLLDAVGNLSLLPHEEKGTVSGEIIGDAEEVMFTCETGFCCGADVGMQEPRTRGPGIFRLTSARLSVLFSSLTSITHCKIVDESDTIRSESLLHFLLANVA